MSIVCRGEETARLKRRFSLVFQVRLRLSTQLRSRDAGRVRVSNTQHVHRVHQLTRE